MQPELKPCPLCECEPILCFGVYDTASYKTYSVQCMDCDLHMEGDTDREGTIAKWNRRPEKPTVAYYVPGEAGFYVAPKFMGREYIPEKHQKTAVRLVEADE